MGININCIYNDSGAWCKNKKIKRSLFDLGARCYKIYTTFQQKCEFQKEFTVPPPPSFSQSLFPAPSININVNIK